MPRERVTHTGDDAEQFREIRKQMGEHLNGELSNAEVNRRLMECWAKHNDRR